MEVSEARRLRALEDENPRLKKLVADQALERSTHKNCDTHGRQQVAGHVCEVLRVSERRACRVLGQHRSTQRRASTRVGRAELRKAIVDVAYEQPRYRYRRVHFVVRRLYALAGLSFRKRRRKRLKVVVRRHRVSASRPNERWSMDFVHDQLADGWRLPIFAAVDGFARR